MQFKIQVKNERLAEPWWEEFDYPVVQDQASAEVFAAQMIINYNNTMRPGDSPRTLLNTVFGIGNANQKHQWSKSNLMTLYSRRQHYDAMRCESCGITGKRFGLEGVVRDREFKPRAFEFCNTAKDLLAKRNQRAATRSGTSKN